MSPENRRSARGLANPARLKSTQKKPADSTSGTAEPGEELLQVVIETPRGSRNKYTFDEEQRTFRLKNMLPAGMVFPFDFGFVPRTRGGDGDPLDVLVLMDEPCFPGCAVLVHLLGVMLVEQTEHGKTFHNDRLIAVAEPSHLFHSFRTVSDLPKTMRKEISAFFRNYHRLIGKRSKTLAWKGPKAARELLREGRKAFKAG